MAMPTSTPRFRAKRFAALKHESELFSTEALEGEHFFHDTVIKFS
jgi:hypothetical protein